MPPRRRLCIGEPCGPGYATSSGGLHEQVQGSSRGAGLRSLGRFATPPLHPGARRLYAAVRSCSALSYVSSSVRTACSNSCKVSSVSVRALPPTRRVLPSACTWCRPRRCSRRRDPSQPANQAGKATGEECRRASVRVSPSSLRLSTTGRKEGAPPHRAPSPCFISFATRCCFRYRSKGGSRVRFTASQRTVGQATLRLSLVPGRGAPRPMPPRAA